MFGGCGPGLIFDRVHRNSYALLTLSYTSCAFECEHNAYDALHVYTTLQYSMYSI